MAEAREISLDKTEKAYLKSELKAQMRAWEVRTAGPARRQFWSRLVPFKINQIILKPMTIFIAILIALTGGASAAAEQALPGDALYNVKVNVNEEVRGWVTLSDEAKANWEAVLAIRRVEEAEKLAVKADSSLDAEARADLEARFQAHADRVEARIARLAEVDAEAAADIAANFAASLKAHDRIISDISASANGQTELELRSLKAKIELRHKATADRQADEEKRVSAGANVQAATEGRLNAAERKVAEVERFIETKSDRLGADATARATARLKVAEDLIAQGEAKLEADAFADAFVLFGRAHATAQEAKLLIQAKVDFEAPAVKEASPQREDNVGTGTPTPTGSVKAKIRIQLDAQ